MKQLEKKIIDSVYVYETRRTVLTVVGHFIVLLCSIGVIIMSIVLMIQEIRYQDGISLLTLIIDDFETFRLYIFDVLYVIFYDFPKIIFVLFGVASFMFGLVLCVLVRNADILRNRIISIMRHRKQKTS